MLTENWLNDTLMPNTTTAMSHIMNGVAPKRHLPFASQLVLTLVYLTGVIGNVSALVILFHRDKVSHTQTHIEMKSYISSD